MLLKYLLIFIALFVYINCQLVQINVLREQYPKDCSSTEFYDITALQCVQCPIYTLPTNDSFNCRCNNTSKFTRNNGGGIVKCESCPPGLFQSFDGWKCVSIDICDKDKGYSTESDKNGAPYVNALTNTNIRKCILCDPSTVATPDGCVSCYPWVFTESPNLNITDIQCSTTCKTTNAGICLTGLTSSTNEPNDFTVPVGNSVEESWFFKKYATTVFYQCRSTSNRNATACQILANMCTLIYNNQQFTSTSKIDVCLVLRQLPQQSLPILDYSVYFGAYKTSSESQVQIYLSYDKTKCISKTLSFVAAKYKLNGNLISHSSIDLTEFELCSLVQSGTARPAGTSFITINYLQTCTITVDKLMSLASSEPIFYELYLRYPLLNGTYALLPVPVIVYNYRERDVEVNRAVTTDNSRMFRRFFLVDQLTAKTSELDKVKYIRYAKTIQFQFKLFTDNKDGRIYPPAVLIDYDYVSTASPLSTTITPQFEIQYRMVLDTQVRDIWISVGILSFFALFWSSIRTWIWNKRSGKQTLDIITIFKFLMYVCGSVANVFFAVCIGVGIWWLIFFKGQDLAFVLIPQYSQEDSFKALLIIAFVLKTLDIIHLIFVQISFDVFIIDWEKPKVEAGSKGSVSCWRTLFVANEWNEIQTARKTNLSIQLVFTLLFLKVINLEAITTIDCNTSVVRDTNAYSAPYSSILRVGMAASIYLLVGIIQWVIYKFIYSRCIEDKLGQFIDFCSVANVSVFVLSHAQYGYYIHGKSPNGNSDTSMKQMVLGFEKEENDLVAKRGLLPDRNNQIFSMAITNKLRNQYSKVMQPLYERRAIRPNEDKVKSNKQVTAYEQLNRFLASFIDHSLRDIDYIVTKRNFLENLLDLEFKEPLERGYFYEDDGPSFQNVIFAGKERTLFIFDLVLFLFVDYFAQNYVLAAFFVYLVSKILNMLRSDLGKLNLSRKTLVDKRFLI